MTDSFSLPETDRFVDRHIGPSDGEIQEMLDTLGLDSLDALADAVVPGSIRLDQPLALNDPLPEHVALDRLHELAQHNEVARSFIGLGYYDCVTPAVIQRNILENPGWYTQYTPYQAEIAQGRLEALLVFQTMVSDLTGLAVANASLLDEATAAAEAMAMCIAHTKSRRLTFFVAEDCHPQTIAVVQSRAQAIGVKVSVGDPADLTEIPSDLCGVLVQYPATDGKLLDYSDLAERVHSAGALLVVATDLMALTLLRPPGEFGADIAFGSSQRFGVPLGFGGPHAAFLSAREGLERQLPGRIVGVSKDADGNDALRLSRQTREQHIRREKATSNICTAQVLLAIMAAMYAVYHGPEGLKRIARRIHRATRIFAAGLRRLAYDLGDAPFFDTLTVRVDHETALAILTAARSRRMNLRHCDDGCLGISFDETVTEEDLKSLLEIFSLGRQPAPALSDLDEEIGPDPIFVQFERTSAFLTHPAFNSYHAEHEMLRYMHGLQARDLSLTYSMIPLGSCTMKLNATSEMFPISWPEFAGIHPFAPVEQTRGYSEMIDQLNRWLGEITGFSAVSMQPNAGAQGEYTGLLLIRAFQGDQGEAHRNICLIPTSAHGTNPASAVMAGLKVVAVACDSDGNIDLTDLAAKAEENRDHLSALMITYPSTHGVFEEDVREVCEIVHRNGGQVYLDGANMNAQVGLCKPGSFGADVCHLNLHKTFSIPHGGGGPGMGPVCVAEHLAPFLPGHPLVPTGGEKAIGPVSAAPYGSPSILPIPWMYIAMMGEAGLTKASQVAVLNANYMAKRLQNDYPVLFTGKNGFVAHEFILDLRELRESAAVSVDDVAKRLMDYGFHAPTISWPVPGAMMIEPTESESKTELDRLCDALISIREEIRSIETGEADRENNPLVRAPHTAQAVTANEWDRPYSRQLAAYPASWTSERKFWPPVARIDNAFGDRHLVCTCEPVEAYEEG